MGMVLCFVCMVWCSLLLSFGLFSYFCCVCCVVFRVSCVFVVLCFWFVCVVVVWLCVF